VIGETEAGREDEQAEGREKNDKIYLTRATVTFIFESLL
jgi:hypothetical protein